MNKAQPCNKWEYENRTAILEYPHSEFLGIKVDTANASWHGRPYKKLDSFERRKFENMLIISYAKSRIRIVYR